MEKDIVKKDNTINELKKDKTVAVFLHSPRMKSLSRNMSEHEAFFESALQLTLLLTIWLSGGRVNKSTIFSSVLVIGKVGAENFLNDGEQLKGKIIWENLISEKKKAK